MATTAIFIEIVMAGVFALAWVLLLLTRLGIFPSATVFSSLILSKRNLLNERELAALAISLVSLWIAKGGRRLHVNGLP